jgi:hypothetical protein
MTLASIKRAATLWERRARELQQGLKLKLLFRHYQCSIKAMLTGQQWLLDDPHTPLRFSVRMDSMRPRLVLEMHFWPVPSTGASGESEQLYKDPGQRIRAEFCAHDERDHGIKPYASRAATALPGDGPHPDARTSFSWQLNDLNYLLIGSNLTLEAASEYALELRRFHFPRGWQRLQSATAHLGN